MSNKKTNKKTAMDDSHDPLSWLLQDTPAAGADSEEVNENNREHDAGEEVDNTVSMQKDEEIEFMDDVLATASNSQESVIENKKEDIAMQAEATEDTDAVGKEVDEVIEDTNSGNEEKLVLDEDISIIRVAQLKENWLPFIDSTKNITIDASQVEDVDTAGLQLLLSFVKTVKATGREIYWDSPSETLSVAVKETALKEVMGLQCD